MYLAAVLLCMVEDPNMCGYRTSPMFFPDEDSCYMNVIEVAPTLIRDPEEIFIAEIKCFKFDYQPPGPAT